MMKDLVDFLAKSLVDHPEKVSVKEVPRDKGSVVFELRVAQDDIGKLSARRGAPPRPSARCWPRPAPRRASAPSWRSSS